MVNVFKYWYILRVLMSAMIVKIWKALIFTRETGTHLVPIALN